MCRYFSYFRDDDSSDQMLDYASQVFSSSFDISSLIKEERISTEDFFNKYTAYGDKETVDSSHYLYLL